MKILCIIVLYKTRFYECNIYKSFLKDALNNKNFYLFIYDNSPEPSDDINELGNIFYVSNTSNPGVSKAYNEGALLAKRKGIEFLLIFDQDTFVKDKRLLEKLCDIVENNDVNLIAPVVVTPKGIFSPLRCFHHIPYKFDFAKNELNDVKNAAIINSGMAIRTSVFFDVDGYNEKVMLDLSDYQFIEHYKRKYKYFYLLDAKLAQSFSDEVDNSESLIIRYGYYLKGVYNFEGSIMTKVDFFFLSLKRCLSLMKRLRSLKPLFMFISYLK